MNRNTDQSEPESLAHLEVERYELREAARYRFDLDRREFVKLLGGGLIVLIAAPSSLRAQDPGRRRGGRGARMPDDLAAWLKIGEDGRITAATGKVEVGQGSRTSLTQAVAEELLVPAGAVDLVMGDTQLTPYDMGTFGSRTTPSMMPQLRRAAAAARAM
ncbi:MAG: molybdopterin cofactor-binding domain-containing protein, partial [Planctomycetota bacterium]